ncbi:hypothetical protein [Hanstruepera ponticola]|uniref:hypothetical protein n=1 Tax=Hanstruepera ponticola TaxID=2042995 RepID=UPI00177F2AB1|nr:hypothetical protein [Hanstruepera ponticola]
MKGIILFLALIMFSFNLSAQGLSEKETKAIHKEHQKAEKEMKRAEKKHKKAEKEHQKKEKARKNLENAKEKYEDNQSKYQKLKAKGKLDADAEEKWLKKLDKLNENIIKTEKKLKQT